PVVLRLVRGEEEAAAAQRGDPQPVAVEDPPRLGGADLGDLVAPGPEPADAGLRAQRRGLRQRELVGRHLIEAHPLRAHCATPASSSTGAARATASSGSTSSRAASASTSSSARCVTERADSRPPTIRKWSWWPLR